MLLDTSALADLRNERRWTDVRAGLGRVKPFQFEDPAPHELPGRLRACGHRVGVVTASPRWYAGALIDRFGIEAEVVVAAGDTELGKPHPDPIDRALGRLGSDPEDAWHVGDAAIDVEASYRARVGSIGVDWGVRATRSLDAASSAAPDVWLKRPEDVLASSPDRLGYPAELALSGEPLDKCPGEILPCGGKETVRYALGRYFVVQDPRHAASRLSESILKLKNSDDPAQLLQRALRSWLNRMGRASEYLVPVPPKPSQKRNRLRAVADGLEAGLRGGTRVVADGLRCVKETAGYKVLSPADRERAVRGSFTSARRWDGAQVLILDDVLTTGSTVEECARVLRGSGASRVLAIAFGKAQNLFMSKTCPECSRPMSVRTNSQTGWQFWGCTGYREGCRHTQSLEKECPKCGRPMAPLNNRSTGERFWGCSGFPDHCRHTEDA